MTYTALQLVTRAYFLSQVVSRDLQTPTGDQITDGLYLLNALLDVKGSDIRLIPYYTKTVFNTVQGQELYFIPNLLSIEELTFNVGPVRFQMQSQGRYKYFAAGRVDNVQSLPFSYHLERTLGGANIYLYYVPNGVLPVNLTGKYGLTDVTLSTDLSTVYDLFYIEYLRYALAEYICSEWAVNFPEQAAMKYKEIRKKLVSVAPPDMHLRINRVIGTNQGINWALVNIPGYLPS